MQAAIPPEMNIHHLELFYYVARHGGISAAARKIPYGIQQPAISAQILRLEQDLEHTLFHRRPFQLTAEGKELFEFITPFFGRLEEVSRRLRGGEEAHLAIGAQELILRDYLPPILQEVRKRVPRFSFTLHSLAGDEIERRLLTQELDMGLGPLVGHRQDGLKEEVLIELPPVLLVPEEHRAKDAAALWENAPRGEPLVSLPSSAPLTRLFQRTLQQRKIEWPASLELPSIDLVARYVAEGHGVGLSMMLPRTAPPEGTRVIALPDFPNLPIGAYWLGNATDIKHHFIESARAFVVELNGNESQRRKARRRS